MSESLPSLVECVTAITSIVVGVVVLQGFAQEAMQHGAVAVAPSVDPVTYNAGTTQAAFEVPDIVYYINDRFAPNKKATKLVFKLSWVLLLDLGHCKPCMLLHYLTRVWTILATSNLCSLDMLSETHVGEQTHGWFVPVAGFWRAFQKT